MALISQDDESFIKCLDEDTGALYNMATSDNSFHNIRVKQVERIGKGSFGIVNLVRSTTDPDVLYAAKLILFTSGNVQQNERWRRRFLMETAILQNLDHKNIVKLHLSAVDPRCGVLMISYCNKGPLYVEEISNLQVLKYFIQILDAVRHMHSRRIVHRDIKLDNILVKDDDVFLTDFDHSSKLSEDSNLVPGGRIGTPQYNAPEVCDSSCKDVYDGLKADAYSVGVVLYCLLTREEPPDDDDFNLWPLLQASKNFDSMDQTLKDCARQLLEKNPDKRVDVTSLYHTLGQNGHVPGYTDDDMECL